MYRIIWRTQPAGWAPGALSTTFSQLGGDPLVAFRGIPTVGAPEPVFPGLEFATGVQTAVPLVMAMPASPALQTFTHAFVRDAGLAREAAARLASTPGVSSVEIQPRPSEAVWWTRPAPVPAALASEPVTCNLRPEQGYLEAPPAGIGIAAAGDVRGAKIRVVDIESGWNFQHEDLRQLSGGVIYGERSDSDHGTAVLGVFSGDANGFGVEGIAPAAIAYAASAFYDAANLRWNMARAILAVARRLRPGDVILLEMHGPGPNTPSEDPYATQDGYVPVEYWESDQLAIRRVTDLGIHVVEAAGNGAEDLDDPIYARRFDRAQFDSGAIVVGAGSSGADGQPRTRSSFSNHGTRVDVQGWGDGIVTTGGLSEARYRDRIWSEDVNRCYTCSFGGTSGATPIVAGCVAVIEGARRAAGLPPLSPRAMRALLVETGTPQDTAVHGIIGPLPNLPRALERAMGM